MRGSVAMAGLLALLVGCAVAQPEPGAGTAVDARTSPTASRMYSMGEEAFAAGRHDAAIRLWRHALLQLPETAAADELRHKLILRIAYGQMVAHAAGGDRTHLLNAQRMLLLYAARHELLFGDTRRAKRERGEVFEILYEVERRLEPEEASPVETPDAEAPKAAPSGGPIANVEVDPDAPAIAWPQSRQHESALPPRKPAPPRRDRTEDTHEGEVLASEIRRDVSVSTREWFNTDVNDPEIRARLSGRLYESTNGAVLTAPRPELIHGPRPLLRQRSPAKLVAAGATRKRRELARTVGRAVFLEARPALRECYGEAVARAPIMLTDSIVEVSVLTDGSVAKARIVDGGLVDGLGDMCLIENLEATTVAKRRPQTPVRLQIAMRFFYEGAKYIHGGTGDTGPLQTLDQSWEGDATSGGMPAIDSKFQHRSDLPQGGPTP